MAAGIFVIVLLPPLATARRAGCPAGMASVLDRFCIDRFEASVDVINARGRTLRRHSPYHTMTEGQRVRARSRRGVVPQGYFSRQQAELACQAAGKRLCTDQEWVSACKGRQPTLYPYGPEHQPGRCNDSGVSPLRLLHGRDDSLATFGIDAMNDPRLNRTPGSVARTGQFARCRNSFGLYDMVGNLHEWTAAPGGTFRGGYYLDTKINGEGCEYQTTAHDTCYHDYSTGFRCCWDRRTKRQSERSLARDRSRAPAGKATAARGRRGKQNKQQVHVVAAGQNLGKIARRYHVTIQQLCEANGIRRRDPIKPGQELVIPPSQ